MSSITITQLTSGSTNGTGVFDHLMRAVKDNLAEEFSAGRIVGKEYSAVYMGAITAVMQNSLQYVLQQQEADKKADLIVQQTLLAVEQTALTAQQKLKEVEQTALLVQQKAYSVEQQNVLVAQKLKLDEEIRLIFQKYETERSQTLDTLDGGGTVAGTIGKQKALYAAQTLGFSRDAEQKLLKQMIDTVSVRLSTDSGTTVSANGLSDVNIKAVVDKAREGIGIAPAV